MWRLLVAVLKRRLREVEVEVWTKMVALQTGRYGLGAGNVLCYQRRNFFLKTYVSLQDRRLRST